MKKLNFSKDNVKNKLKKFGKFLKKNYVTFFKKYPLFAFFIVSVLINTLLLRIITVHNGL